MGASVEERVRAGATFLDAHVPGWAEKIDKQALDIEDCTGCVIGQTHNSYTDALDEFGLTDEQEVGYGFESSRILVIKTTDWSVVSTDALSAINAGIDAEFAALRTAWLAEIAARCQPAGDADATEDETLRKAWAEMPL